MINSEVRKAIAVWFRHNCKEKLNIKNFIIERICKYSKEKRPPEQIVGMVTVLDDLLKLEEEYFKG